MPEKTVNDCQRFILLRSRVMAIFLCCALIFCIMVFPASAAELNYKDYITNIVVDGDNDIVTVTLPTKDNTYYRVYDETDHYEVVYDSKQGITSFGHTFRSDHLYSVRIIPAYDHQILSGNIPNGTVVTFDIAFDSNASGYNTPNISTAIEYYDVKDALIGFQNDIHGYSTLPDSFPLSCTLNYPANTHSFDFFVDFQSFAPLETDFVWFEVKSYTLTMSISALYKLQQQTGKTNEILTEVEKQLEANGQTLQEVLDAQQQTNDKLDQLPGQVGDEIQGIIDNEKEESKNEGNEFVDQILDALPDPSAEVLRAMKSLTDATSYTGTDAVLPIPAIVLPGIDGLFPETVIWGGDSFDFGEYMEMLPPALLTLIQSLFTIAIVLFCVYELKGIIDYCLTLRDKGGN